MATAVTNAFTVTIFAGATLSPAGVEQAQRLDTVTLTQAYLVTLDEVTQAQLLDDVSLQAGSDLLLAAIEQNQSLGDVQVTQANTLALNELTQEQIVASTRLGSLVIGYLEGELTIVLAIEGEIDIQLALEGDITIH